MAKTFWVGGATGFLGSHLVRLLLDRGERVIGVARSPGDAKIESPNYEFRALDVLDESAVARSAEGCDGAFVATGVVSRQLEDAELVYRSNVLGTRSVLRALSAARVPRLVLASTSGTVAVGSDPEAIYDEESSPPDEIICRWPYYRSKLYAEREALAANSSEFEVIVANPSLLLGPGDLRESSTGDVRQFLEASIPAVPAGGLAFVDVRDAALGMWLAFERGRPGQRYLLNGRNMTIAAFFQRLERLTGVSAPWLKLPRSKVLARGTNQVFSKVVRALGGEPPVDAVSAEMAQYFWYCSSEKAERELGWCARDPGETLRDTVDDLIARGVVYPKRSRAAVS
jgi:dihydroflavonol-4-reductase